MTWNVSFERGESINCLTLLHLEWPKLQLQGSYRQVGVKFKDFSRTSKTHTFQELKVYEKS